MRSQGPRPRTGRQKREGSAETQEEHLEHRVGLNASELRCAVDRVRTCAWKLRPVFRWVRILACTTCLLCLVWKLTSQHRPFPSLTTPKGGHGTRALVLEYWCEHLPSYLFFSKHAFQNLVVGMLVRNIVCGTAVTKILARKAGSKNTLAVRWAAALTPVDHSLLQSAAAYHRHSQSHRSSCNPPRGRATIPSTGGLRRVLFRELQPTLGVFKLHCVKKQVFSNQCNVHSPKTPAASQPP